MSSHRLAELSSSEESGSIFFSSSSCTSVADDEPDQRLPVTKEDPPVSSGLSECGRSFGSQGHIPSVPVLSSSMPACEALKKMIKTGAQVAVIVREEMYPEDNDGSQSFYHIKISEVVKLFNCFPSAPLSECIEDPKFSRFRKDLDTVN